MIIGQLCALHLSIQVLGTVARSQPDWFIDSLDELKPLLSRNSNG